MLLTVSDLLTVVYFQPIRQRRRRNLYFSDFGGNREAADGNDPAVTAGREFAEETLGMFGGVGVDQASVATSSVRMAAKLAARGVGACVKAPTARGAYVMYVAEVGYIDALMFHLAREQNDRTNTVGPAG